MVHQTRHVCQQPRPRVIGSTNIIRGLGQHPFDEYFDHSGFVMLDDGPQVPNRASGRMVALVRTKMMSSDGLACISIPTAGGPTVYRR